MAKTSRNVEHSSTDSKALRSLVSHKGRSTTLPRLIAGLLHLLHAFDLSDE
ncbi:hypothetical protein ACW9YQ_16800 (plasmid) [Paraburkholderia strydomiana]